MSLSLRFPSVLWAREIFFFSRKSFFIAKEKFKIQIRSLDRLRFILLTSRFRIITNDYEKKNSIRKQKVKNKSFQLTSNKDLEIKKFLIFSIYPKRRTSLQSRRGFFPTKNFFYLLGGSSLASTNKGISSWTSSIFHKTLEALQKWSFSFLSNFFLICFLVTFFLLRSRKQSQRKWSNKIKNLLFSYFARL